VTLVGPQRAEVPRRAGGYGTSPPPPLSRMHVPSNPIVQDGPGVVVCGGAVVGIGAGVGAGAGAGPGAGA